MDMVGQQSGLWKMWDEGRMLCHVSPQQTEMSFSATRPRSAAAAVCFPCTAPVNSFTCRLPFQKETGIISTLTISRAHTSVYGSSAWAMIHPLHDVYSVLALFQYLTYETKTISLESPKLYADITFIPSQFHWRCCDPDWKLKSCSMVLTWRGFGTVYPADTGPDGSEPIRPASWSEF